MPEKVSRGARLVVGLISGTSMDGIDAALVRISGPAAQPRVRLVAFETLAYSAQVRQAILRIATGESATAGEISQLNFLLGEIFAEAALTRLPQSPRLTRAPRRDRLPRPDHLSSGRADSRMRQKHHQHAANRRAFRDRRAHRRASGGGFSPG